MIKTKQWSVNIDGANYQITFTPNQWSGKHKLEVNGKQVELQKSPFQTFTGMDRPLKLGNKECRFVIIGNMVDIAVDGAYIESKKPYVPLKSIPWWSWIFVFACIAIPIVALGGALPVVIAMFGAIYCVRVSVSPYTKTSKKVLSCIGITALAWGVFEFLLFAMSSI